MGSLVCGSTPTRRLLPQAPGLAAKRVSEPPEAMALANPVLLTVATAGAEEAQVAVAVRFCGSPAENVPMAFNCAVWPLLRRETLAGVMAMD